MAPVLSLHCYRLAPGVDPSALARAFARAKEEGLFDLPGLQEVRLLHGLRGQERGQWAALWIYKSRQAWQELWGPVGAASEPQDYPAGWRRWERELLAPLLDRDPDKVTLTAYQQVDFETDSSEPGPATG